MYQQKMPWRRVMSKTLSVRVSDELALKLSEIAKETERSESFHVQKALESYLYEFADLQVAYKRLYDKTDPAISIEDMRKALDL
jgi:RHH-type rel operon transcriptional repressor/antitoxin RelB